ncbi:MAG: hypothetical protein LBH00_01920 [Planctomycetaceae bacterium]|jgi:WD40 repeat protein|nr:hypothetical protein [Planctomycetaceae bacterium]
MPLKFILLPLIAAGVITAGFCTVQAAEEYSAETGHLLLGNRQDTLAGNFSADSKRAILLSGKTFHAEVFDTETGKHVQTFGGKSRRMIFSPNRETVLLFGMDSADTPGTAVLWETNTGKRLHEFASISRVQFSQNSKVLAATNEKEFTVSLFCTETGKEQRKISADKSFRNAKKDVPVLMDSVVLSPDGSKFMILDRPAKTIRLVNTDSGKEQRIIKKTQEKIMDFDEGLATAHLQDIFNAEFSADGKWIYLHSGTELSAVSSETLLEQWKRKNTVFFKQIPLSPSYSPMFLRGEPLGHQDGKPVDAYYVSHSHEVFVCDVKTGKDQFKLKERIVYPNNISFASRPRYYPIAFLPLTRDMIHSIQDQEQKYTSAKLIPFYSNSGAAALFDDHQHVLLLFGNMPEWDYKCIDPVRDIWDYAAGKRLMKLYDRRLKAYRGYKIGMYGLHFSPDGKKVLAECGEEIHLFDLADYERFLYKKNKETLAANPVSLVDYFYARGFDTEQYNTLYSLVSVGNQDIAQSVRERSWAGYSISPQGLSMEQQEKLKTMQAETAKKVFWMDIPFYCKKQEKPESAVIWFYTGVSGFPVTKKMPFNIKLHADLPEISIDRTKWEQETDSVDDDTIDYFEIHVSGSADALAKLRKTGMAYPDSTQEYPEYVDYPVWDKNFNDDYVVRLTLTDLHGEKRDKHSSFYLNPKGTITDIQIIPRSEAHPSIGRHGKNDSTAPILRWGWDWRHRMLF